jgi:hypothetical protein
MIENKIIYHEFKGTLLPELIDDNLAYNVELSADDLHPFAISVLALNETLIDKITISDTSDTNKLVIRTREINKQSSPKGRNFISIVDFDLDDLTIVNTQISCSDLATLIHKLLEHILKLNVFYFEHKCQDFHGKYNHYINWWCS